MDNELKEELMVSLENRDNPLVKAFDDTVEKQMGEDKLHKKSKRTPNNPLMNTAKE